MLDDATQLQFIQQEKEKVSNAIIDKKLKEFKKKEAFNDKESKRQLKFKILESKEDIPDTATPSRMMKKSVENEFSEYKEDEKSVTNVITNTMSKRAKLETKESNDSIVHSSDPISPLMTKQSLTYTNRSTNKRASMDLPVMRSDSDQEAIIKSTEINVPRLSKRVKTMLDKSDLNESMNLDTKSTRSSTSIIEEEPTTEREIETSTYNQVIEERFRPNISPTDRKVILDFLFNRIHYQLFGFELTLKVVHLLVKESSRSFIVVKYCMEKMDKVDALFLSLFLIIWS